ncbi:hypothetical protein DFAR_3820029 [Desulfarculales bacterium]
MRQEHRAGEKTFIDYASQTVDVVVPLTDVRLGRSRSSWQFWVAAITPLPRPRGPKVCPTGSAPFSGPSSFLAG